MVFVDTEFEMKKAYREFKDNLQNHRFTNADSIGIWRNNEECFEISR